METKQLNVWVPEEYRNHVATRAEEEQCGMNKIIADLIRDDIARRNGEFTQQTSLVVLQEMISTEFYKAHAQLRQNLRADREEERESWLEYLKKQFDRIAGLAVFSTRNGGISRRLLYTLIAKAHGGQFAKEAYDHAAAKTQEELSPKKKAIDHYVLTDDAAI